MRMLKWAWLCQKRLFCLHCFPVSDFPVFLNIFWNTKSIIIIIVFTPLLLKQTLHAEQNDSYFWPCGCNSYTNWTIQIKNFRAVLHRVQFNFLIWKLRNTIFSTLTLLKGAQRINLHFKPYLKMSLQFFHMIWIFSKMSKRLRSKEVISVWFMQKYTTIVCN